MQSPSPRRRPDASQQALQSKGFTLAVIAGTAGVMVVGGYLLFGTSPKVSLAPATVGQVKAPPPGAGTDPRVATSSDVRIDLMDKKDPTRQAGRLVFKEMDPLEAHHYAADEPQAFLYTREGKTVHIRSDKGKLYMPDRSKEPESGTLTGHVVIRVFEAPADGHMIDILKDPPSLTLRTDSLAFDNALGKVDTTDRVTVSTPELEFAGRGLRMIFNQVRQRLELLEIAEGEELRYTRGPEGTTSAKKTAKAPAPATPPPPTRAVAAAPPTTVAAPQTSPIDTSKQPVETLYKVVFSQGVTATQDRRGIQSDQLTAWARFIDNKLPEGAIAQVRAAPSDKATPMGPPASAATPENPGTGTPAPATTAQATPPGPTVNAPIGSPAPAPGPSNAAFVLRWSGPCVITPLDSTPPELKQDHVAMRFTSEQSGLVTLKDEARGATGHGAYLEYGATTRKLALAGPGPSSASLEIPGSGTIAAVRLDTTITDEATIVHAPGPSVLRGPTDASGRPPFTVSSTEQADFTLENQKGAITGALRQALFQGQVKLTNASGKSDGPTDALEGDHVRADFERTPQEASSLKRLIVEGHVVADSAQTGKLHADSLDVSFRPGAKAGSPDPTSLTAQGHVRLDKEGTSLSGDFLEAALARSAKGAVEVTTATARGGVKYSDKAGNLAADCEQLKLDLTADAAAPGGGGHRQIADLTGEKTVIRQGEQTVISGTQMRLDGAASTLQVFGAGTFDHEEPRRAAGAVPGSVHATWTEQMTFDDGKGLVKCAGNVVANASPDPFTRDRVDAEHVTLTISPRKPADAAASPDVPGAKKDKDRRLLGAVAEGSVLDRDGGQNARIESRRYAPGDGGAEPRLTEIYYVEGPRVLADNERGTMDVPTAGRMLLLDQRSPGAGDRAPAPPTTTPGQPQPLPKDNRGTALFDWQGSMHMDRPSGVMTLAKGVKLTHQKLETRDVTNLTCAALTARFREKAASPGQPATTQTGGELVSAVATGGVYLSNGPEVTPAMPKPPNKELAADRIDYDALKRTADATALPGALVRFTEPTHPVPMTASHLFWDLASDRVKVMEPGSVVAPK